MTPRGRKRLFDAIRVTICGVALWIVIRGVTLSDHVTLKTGRELVGVVTDEQGPVVIRLVDGTPRQVPLTDIALDEQGQPRIAYGLKTAWANSTKALLLLAVMLHLPVGLFQAIRLQWLLSVQNIYVGYWECVKFSFAGNFLNFATPLGSNAGDVFKAYFVSTHTDYKTEAITTIALDRAIGLSTLIVCVAAITAFAASDSRLAMFRPYVLTMVGIGLVCVFAYFSATLRKYLVPRKLLERLPMFEQLQRIDNAAHALISSKRILVAAVGVTLVLQVMAIGAYFTIAIALALDAHTGNALEYYAYFYTGAVIQALPGPPQGLGTVELAYRYFLAPFGSPSQIVCVAFLARVVVLTCALPGLLVTMTGSYRPRQARLEQVQTPSQSSTAVTKRDLAANCGTNPNV